MFVDNAQRCFAFTAQAYFPTHNLNFHWRWRWWNLSYLLKSFLLYTLKYHKYVKWISYLNDFSESPMPAFPGQGLPVGLVHNNGLAIFIIGLGSLLWYCFQPSEAGPTASTQLVQFGLGPSFAFIFLSLNIPNMFYKQLVKNWILLLTTIAYFPKSQLSFSIKSLVFYIKLTLIKVLNN